jgi:hypothetical protein
MKGAKLPPMKPISEADGVPTQSLTLLRDTAFGDTGGSQAARSFLFWLSGHDDPTGYRGDGALELRRLDERHRLAALEVLSWWAGGTETDQPVFDIVDELLEEFRGSSTNPKVSLALGNLEQAQRLVNVAAEDLCSVEGYADQWTDATSLYRMIKELWHAVDSQREELQHREASE